MEMDDILTGNNVEMGTEYPEAEISEIKSTDNKLGVGQCHDRGVSNGLANSIAYY